MLAAYMGSKLTQRLVDGAKAPENGQILIRDSEVRGFALRITAKGCKTWVWDGRIRRQMRRISIARYPDLSLNEARAEALGIRHDIAIGLDPSLGREEDPIEITLGKIAQRYLEEHSKRTSVRGWMTNAEYESTCAHSLNSKSRRSAVKG
jgi:Arm DNA-binding domain